ncbi:hypothetical protein [Nocardioides sp. GY 10113]|uniref:trypsin-like serine peptidase n=1 Tax=Nocardioides sp. GY 10113 TaxID=2569761 RepID=UPI0014580B3D|nr:hypothetical protein [Nocardioides sp. GY 10113]
MVLLVALGLAVGLLGGPAASAPATARAGPGDGTGGDASPIRVLDRPTATRPAAARRYWTAERMAAAIPLDLVASPGTASDAAVSPRRSAGRLEASAPRRAAVAADASVPVPRWVGKLFFRDGSADYSCSAAALRNGARNQVLTAGHCVHTGPNPSGIPIVGGLLDEPRFYSDWVFVPRYRNGRAPFGRWAARTAYVTAGWAEQEDYAEDQGVVVLRRRDGKRIVGAVGGGRVSIGLAPRQRRVRIWGWPAAAPFDGQKAWRCDGRTRRTNNAGAVGDAILPCTMTAGASGGPWMVRPKRKAKVGPIWAVTSRGLTTRPRLIAQPLGEPVRRLIRAAASG